MRKIVLLLAAVLPLIVISCSKEEEEKKPHCEVVIYNDMDLSRTQVSNGNLYNVTLGTTKGEILEVGNINNGKSVSYTMPEGYTSDDSFIFFLKLSPNGNDLSTQGYILLYSGNNPVLFPLKEDKPVEIHITENTVARKSNYTKKGDLITILQSAGL
jgi:hypothetical protein